MCIRSSCGNREILGLAGAALPVRIGKVDGRKPMMHEPKKSDLAIVATKPTNNAARAAAEPVERRAGAKGNAGQQSTDRTQGRTRVSQALERVRQAAKSRKKERFTALLHHVTPDLLRWSFYALKRRAAPGVDGVVSLHAAVRIAVASAALRIAGIWLYERDAGPGPIQTASSASWTGKDSRSASL